MARDKNSNVIEFTFLFFFEFWFGILLPMVPCSKKTQISINFSDDYGTLNDKDAPIIWILIKTLPILKKDRNFDDF